MNKIDSEYIFNKPISGLDNNIILNNVIRQALADFIRSEFDKNPRRFKCVISF